MTAWQDKLIVDAWYDAYAPYIETNLAVRDQIIRAELRYLDPKEFPQAKNANPREFVRQLVRRKSGEVRFLSDDRLGQIKVIAYYTIRNGEYLSGGARGVFPIARSADMAYSDDQQAERQMKYLDNPVKRAKHER